MAVFWLFVSAAIIIQGISKSGFAGGAGILSMPLMFFVMPVNRAAAVMLPLLILCDMNAIYHHRHNKDWKTVLRIYLPSLFGILAGAAVWWWIGQEGVERYGIWIKRFVGVIAIVFALYIVSKEAAMSWVDRFRPGAGVGVIAGLAAGFSSTIAHAAGPIVSLYIFAQDLGKTLFVGTVAHRMALDRRPVLPCVIRHLFGERRQAINRQARAPLCLALLNDFFRPLFSQLDEAKRVQHFLALVGFSFLRCLERS